MTRDCKQLRAVYLKNVMGGIIPKNAAPEYPSVLLAGRPLSTTSIIAVYSIAKMPDKELLR